MSRKKSHHVSRLTIGYLWEEYEKFWFFIMCHIFSIWLGFSGHSLLILQDQSLLSLFNILAPIFQCKKRLFLKSKLPCLTSRVTNKILCRCSQTSPQWPSWEHGKMTLVLAISAGLTVLTETATYNVQKIWLTVTPIFYCFCGYIHNIIAVSAIKS